MYEDKSKRCEPLHCVELVECTGSCPITEINKSIVDSNCMGDDQEFWPRLFAISAQSRLGEVNMDLASQKPSK